MGQGNINKNIERNTFSPMYLSGERTWQGFFIMQIATSFYGGWRGPTGQITSLVLTRKVHIGWLRLSFCEKLKEQVKEHVKSRCGNMDFSSHDSILCLQFSLLTRQTSKQRLPVKSSNAWLIETPTTTYVHNRHEFHMFCR